MPAQSDWIWDIITCPECGAPISRGADAAQLHCSNTACDYQSERWGAMFNLLPRELDAFQKAENDFRASLFGKIEVDFKTGLRENLAAAPGQAGDAQYSLFKLLNTITYYSFTSEYFFFRDHFSKRYRLQGRGLEIGGATGQLSAFARLFYPGVELVTSDVAPINVRLAEELARFLRFGADYFVMADAERLPFAPASFDFLLSSGMLHHLGDLPAALRKGHAALKPGGRWYVVNELSIGPLPRLFWNSRLGEKGKWAQRTGIRENSYTLGEWLAHFEAGGFKVAEVHFHTNPKHKLLSWSRSLYYALISHLPPALLRMGVPCEVNFVLEKV